MQGQNLQAGKFFKPKIPSCRFVSICVCDINILLTGTIRDNILFGQPYNSQRYAELSGLLHPAHQYSIFLKLHGNCIIVVEDGEVRIGLKLSSFLLSGGGVTE